jgi:hypothetical protein
MLHKPQELLREAGRFWELVVGYACAVISTTFTAIFIWLVYLVTWRNPREYGVNDLFKVSTLSIFTVLLVIAVWFSALALRLIVRKPRHCGLLSPMLLRIWGAFFAITSIIILINCIANKRWTELWRSWEILAVTIPMALAAFVLAKVREQLFKKKIRPDEPA